MEELNIVGCVAFVSMCLFFGILVAALPLEKHESCEEERIDADKHDRG